MKRNRNLITSPDEAFAQLTETFAALPGVTQGTGKKKGFGATALCVKGNIFALLSRNKRLVVKLPKPRADALVGAGTGRYFDPGHGRLMKQWVEISDGHASKWRTIVEEAFSYVSLVGP
jgi:hypothetical protein